MMMTSNDRLSENTKITKKRFLAGISLDLAH